jgi:hypothetical protein
MSSQLERAGRRKNAQSPYKSDESRKGQFVKKMTHVLPSKWTTKDDQKNIYLNHFKRVVERSLHHAFFPFPLLISLLMNLKQD